MLWSKTYSICLQNIVEWKYEVAENGNTQEEYKYLTIKVKHSTWVSVL